MLVHSLLAATALMLSVVSALPQDIPDDISPPQGSAMIGTYAATGAQIYVCGAKDGANVWRFKAPEADLSDAQGSPFARHYAGPTWEARDGSKIVGTILASKPSSKADTIPWLLLSAKSSGSGVLAGVRFVQRVDTFGGARPTGACPKVGAELRVAYTADYIFYK